MDRFEGDLSTLWRFDVLPPIKRLSGGGGGSSLFCPIQKSEKVQTVDGFMVHKETPSIRVNDHWWSPGLGWRLIRMPVMFARYGLRMVV